MVRPSPQSAFTVLETLITIAILGIVVIGVISALSSAFLADRTSTEIISSRNLAQRVMESVEAVAFDHLLGMDGARVNDGDLTAHVTVDVVAAGLLRVEVRVTHAQIVDVNTHVVTLVADRG